MDTLCEASGKFGAQLAITNGLMPINQPPQWRGAVSGYLGQLSDWHPGTPSRGYAFRVIYVGASLF